jgi:hypothetical protein
MPKKEKNICLQVFTRAYARLRASVSRRVASEAYTYPSKGFINSPGRARGVSATLKEG